MIWEELDEMWDEVRANNSVLASEEAVQVAAMAVRFILDRHPLIRSNVVTLQQQANYYAGEPAQRAA